MQVQGLNLKRMSFEEVDSLTNVYKFGLINMMSETILEKDAVVSNIDWTEFIEAYLFDENQELHILRDGDEIYAIEAKDDGVGIVMSRAYELASKFSSVGRRLIVNEYMGKDEDGQNFVAYTRLTGIE